MRRITFLFASFLLFLAGTMVAHAQSELVGKSWYIQNAERVVNSVHRYMSAANGTTLRMANTPTLYEVFVVQAGSSEEKIKLYNEASNKYIGHIPNRDNQAVPLVDESEAAEYTVTQQDGGSSWALIDEQITDTDHNTLHGMGDGDNVVRWTESENASHWTFKEFTGNKNNCITDLSQLEAGKYYQIFSSRSIVPLKYISNQSINAGQDGTIDANTSRVINRTDGSVILPTLWEFEATADEEATYYLRNINSALYFGQIKDNNQTPVEMLAPNTDKQWAGKYTLSFSSDFDSWLIKCGENWLNALGGGNQTTTIGDWNDNRDEDEGNYWFIQPVTEIPVTVYSDTQWASLTLPFAAELPEGLTAYYASKAEGDVLTLTAIEGQQIPAHTPVLLAPDAPIDADQTYQLTILYGTEVPALTAENKLEGTTAARTGFGESEVYVLASNGSEGVLKKNGSVNTIPCNKSYIPVSAFAPTTAAAPAYVQMQIGKGESTGIEGVQTAAPQAEEVYYDLQGRRVLYPAHGVFVTKSGQKVFIR